MMIQTRNIGELWSLKMVHLNEKDKEYLEGQIEGLLNEIKTVNPYGSSLHYMREKIDKISNVIADYEKNKPILKSIKIQDEEIYPNGQWVIIAHERFEDKVSEEVDEKIYFYVDDDLNFESLKTGDEIQLDELFTIIEVA